MFDDSFLSHFVKTSAVPIQDLSWLDINEKEYRLNERLPDNKKTLNIKDQLKELWDHKCYSGPSQFSLVPNIDKKPAPFSEDNVKEADVKDLVRRTRLEIAQGKTSSQINNFIRKNFDKRTINASLDELQEISKEHGLLGFIYVDPGLFECQSSKISSLKHPFTEFVLKRAKCDDCKFNANQTCLKFENSLVEKISFNEELADAVSKRVSSLGFEFIDDISLVPSERIRKIFLTKHEKQSHALTSFPQDCSPRITANAIVTDEILEEKTREAHEEIVNLKRAENRAIIKDVIGFLKTCFIQGIYGDKAVKALKKKFAFENLKLAEENIRDLFKEQGLFGGIYITLGALGDNCDEISKTLKQAKSTARFLQKAPQCFSCVHANSERCLKLDLTFLDKDIPINDDTFNYFVEVIGQRKNISTEEILSRIGHISDKRLRFKELCLLEAEPRDRLGGQEASLYSLGQTTTGCDLERNARIITQIKQALEQGVSLRSIKSKVETLVPGSLASNLIKKAFSEIGFISVKSFEYCQKLGNQGYNLSKHASLKPKDSCVDCLFNSKVYCTKIGKKFSGQSFKVTETMESNRTQEEIKEFFDGSKISIELNPKAKVFEGEIEGLNEFNIE